MSDIEREAGTPVARRQRVTAAIDRGCAYLLARQNAQGYWVGALEADASVSAGYGPLMLMMQGAVNPERQRKACRQVRRKQNPDGSWSAYEGGPGDLSVSIQCYWSLKLAGAAQDDPCLQKARAFILGAGGIGKANLITKVWLALFGQFDWRDTPSIPPELILLPNGAYINLYEFASWSRATIVALSVLLTLRPVFQAPGQVSLEELYVEPPGRRRYPPGQAERALSWAGVFLGLDRLFKFYERLPFKPGRQWALRRMEQWIVDRQEADGSWGGIMLPWIYSLAALKALGYPQSHPVIQRGLAGLEGFIIEDDECLLLQPATSPVWDTAWGVLALREAGLGADHPDLRRAARWLLQQEVRTGGDWQVKNPHTEPGCWAFEFENDCYPDVDDTAVVARALARVTLPAESEGEKWAAIGRGLRWVISMQCRDGGFAAFDRDCNRRILAHVPFADFMTPLDPTCADVTAHVVELLAERAPDAPALQRALDYFWRSQEPDGAWYGRWGVNYIYGTGLTLGSLRTLAARRHVVAVGRAVQWLLSRQNADGGWGESCETYADPTLRGRGASTVSQTAWALIGLLGAGEGDSPAVRRGVDYLLRAQQADGSWRESLYTGTGFPRAFYLHYELYPVYFSLIALAQYRAIGAD